MASKSTIRASGKLTIRASGRLAVKATGKAAIREDELIEQIRRRLPSAPGGLLRVGVGDDAAVLRPRAGADWILTCDQFIEGAHFLGAVHPPESVGYKALARAASDVAAMGGWPRLFLLSMALPRERTGGWLDAMLRGMARAARELGLVLAGGDTARAGRAGKVSLSITVLGEIQTGRAVLRSGARAGDAIFVTGRLGGAQLGLELVLRGLYRQRRWRQLLAPHYFPTIRIATGQWLSRRRLATAMMDLSDGLSTDLTRLCQASGVGARIWEEQIPRVDVSKELRARGIEPLDLALDGGEDYELLFTVSRRTAGGIPRRIAGTPVTCIGEIVRGHTITLERADGRQTPIVPRGWDHFR